LWLPALIAAAGVFVASSVIHMLLPYHRTDYEIVPDEDQVMAALRKFSIPPGDYLVPCPRTPQQMRSQEFVEKRKQGPVAVMTVLQSGAPSMSKNLVNWFVYCVIVSLFVAYLASQALPRGVSFATAFHFTGLFTFGCHALGLWPQSIWYGHAWSTTFKSTVDSLVYAVVTGAAFGWLWPS
jgi:hypothetical protein